MRTPDTSSVSIGVFNVVESRDPLKEVSKSTWEFDMTDRLYLRTRDLAQAGGLFIHDFSWTDVEAGVDGKG